MRKEAVKPNLIIVHSFPTNSVILAGLIRYVQQWFTVFFIDLAGFTHQVEQLKTYSIDSHAQYVSQRIKKLGLSSYYIMGISFGFLLISTIKLDSACKGILAIAPFIGQQSLRMSSFVRRFYVLLLWIIIRTHLSVPLWNSQFFVWIFPRFIFRNQPQKRVSIILSTIRAQAFFETVYAILTYKKHIVLDKTKKYALVLHAHDERVNSAYIQNFFALQGVRYKSFMTTMEHFPKTDLDSTYFKKYLSKHLIAEIQHFLYD